MGEIPQEMLNFCGRMKSSNHNHRNSRAEPTRLPNVRQQQPVEAEMMEQRVVAIAVFFDSVCAPAHTFF